MNKPATGGIFLPYINDFIALKHNLGYAAANMEGSLKAFDRFAKSRGMQQVSIPESLSGEWCARRKGEANDTWSHRVNFLRQFCVYLFNLGFDVHIPGKYPSKHDEVFIPYIYSQEEMQTIFTAVDNLRLHDRHMNHLMFIMPALVRLLYATGLRIGEALALKTSDVNIESGFLIVSKSKNGKERIVPFTENLSGVLSQYLSYRGKLPCMESDNFFMKPNGEGGLTRKSVYYWWNRILSMAGIPRRGEVPGPRIQDLRHTFCVRSMKKMTEEGKDLYYALPVLSTYVGHSSLAATDRYVRMTADMYPGLLGKTESICSYIFPQINPR